MNDLSTPNRHATLRAALEKDLRLAAEIVHLHGSAFFPTFERVEAEIKKHDRAEAVMDRVGAALRSTSKACVKPRLAKQTLSPLTLPTAA